jgi:hypothetical protein
MEVSEHERIYRQQKHLNALQISITWAQRERDRQRAGGKGAGTV